MAKYIPGPIGSRGWLSQGAGLLALFISLALAVAAGLSMTYKEWALKPAEKFASAWSDDIALIASSKTANAQLLQKLRNIKVTTNGPSPVQDWIESIKPPLKSDEKSGSVDLDILVVHQFSEPTTDWQPQRYGVLVQYEFTDVKTGNKVAEFARTLWLGIYH